MQNHNSDDESLFSSSGDNAQMHQLLHRNNPSTSNHPLSSEREPNASTIDVDGGLPPDNAMDPLDEDLSYSPGSSGDDDSYSSDAGFSTSLYESFLSELMDDGDNHNNGGVHIFGHSLPRFSGNYKLELSDPSPDRRHPAPYLRFAVYRYLIESQDLPIPSPMNLVHTGYEFPLTHEHALAIDQISITYKGEDFSLAEFRDLFPYQFTKMAVLGELPNVLVPTIREPRMSLDFCLPVLYNGMNIENLLSVDVAQLQGQLDESHNWTVVAKMDRVYEAKVLYGSAPPHDNERVTIASSSGRIPGTVNACNSPTNLNILFQQKNVRERARNALTTMNNWKNQLRMQGTTVIQLATDFVLSIRARDFTRAFVVAGWISLQTLTVEGNKNDVLDLLMRIEEPWAYGNLTHGDCVCPLRRDSGRPWYTLYPTNEERLHAFKLFIVRFYQYAVLRYAINMNFRQDFNVVPPGVPIQYYGRGPLDDIHRPSGTDLLQVALTLFNDDVRSERTNPLLNENNTWTLLGEQIKTMKQHSTFEFRPVFEVIGQLWDTRQSTFHVPFQLKPGSTRWTPFLSGFYGHPLNVHGHARLMTYTLSSTGHTQWESTEYHYHDFDDPNYHPYADDDWNPWRNDEHQDNDMCFETTRLKSVVDSWTYPRLCLPRMPIADGKYFEITTDVVHGSLSYFPRPREYLKPFGIDLEQVFHR